MLLSLRILAVLVVIAWGWPLHVCHADEPAAAIPESADTSRSSAADKFDAEIAPLLAARCLQCHNATEKKGGLDLTHREAALAGGDSGSPLAAGKPEDSLLWQRVADDEMPPKKPLNAAEKKVLQEWIGGGSEWGTSPIDYLKFTSDVRAGHDWWALQPVRHPTPPPVNEAAWVRNPIDQFVLARLEQEQLHPSPEADRRTLIRRLSFDLTGLPPTPDEVAAFVAETDPRAYDRLVDRLLASPAYGERWARHWLDVARFGESNGFEYDEPRRNAWPYRDWVIDALNRDLPFDEFTRQQLAGDLLLPGDPEATKATGFWVAGPYDTPGQNQQSLAMRAVVRQDELEDLVGTVCQTFLALTVNCARCHDHKFDPIRQKEYYQLTAALGGVRHGERDITTPAQESQFAEQAAERNKRIEQFAAQIKTLEEPARKEILAQRQALLAAPSPPPAPSARWDFDADTNDAMGVLSGELRGGAMLRSGGLVLDGNKSLLATSPLKHDLQAKTLEAWVSLDNLKQAGGGVIGVQSLDGGTFDAIVFGEREPGCWMAGSENFTRTQSFAGPPETEAADRLVHVAIVYDADGTITGYRDGQPYGKPYRGPPPVTFKAGEAHVVLGMRHAPAGGNRMLAGVIDRAQLHSRALSAEEIAASAGTPTDYVSETDLVAHLTPEVSAERTRLNAEADKLRAQQIKPARELCYAVQPKQPEPARLLVRGDLRQPAEIVAPGGLAALSGAAANFGVAPEAAEASGRAALAKWITSTDNPLFPRVIVNRVWHHHFGVGLVDTPNDFGFNGGRPSHPELLDWLATSLAEQGWSLKQLHRTILLSATYRQASLTNEAAMKRDADNRLLWRKSPLRLDAELVRDAVLTVAGEMNPARGGPGFRDCTEVLRSGSYSYVPGDPVGVDFNRRSIYRVWTRGGRSGLLDAFDCPDPSTTTPKRAVTTTPLQALALMNNSFVLRMAESFAARVEREAGSDQTAQVARAYRLAFGREPNPDEAAIARQAVKQHGLGVLSRAIFNSNEFLYID